MKITLALKNVEVILKCNLRTHIMDLNHGDFLWTPRNPFDDKSNIDSGNRLVSAMLIVIFVATCRHSVIG